MATEKQYQFFKALYDEENRRHAELADRAKMYIGVITLYVGAISFKIEDIAKFARQENVPIWLFLFVGAIFVGALLFSVWAVFIRDYEGITDAEALVEQFGAGASDRRCFLFGSNCRCSRGGKSQLSEKRFCRNQAFDCILVAFCRRVRTYASVAVRRFSIVNEAPMAHQGPLREGKGKDIRPKDDERRAVTEVYRKISQAKTFAEKLEERRKISIKKK
jgi:hypothetical protein